MTDPEPVQSPPPRQAPGIGLGGPWVPGTGGLEEPVAGPSSPSLARPGEGGSRQGADPVGGKGSCSAPLPTPRGAPALLSQLRPFLAHWGVSS